MEKYRVGVIGMGMMGALHAKIYSAMPEVELAGLAESSAAAAERLRGEYGIPVYADYRELLGKVDAVSVCTPDDFHKPVILDAFKSGVKVLVEKPLEVSSALCGEIIAARPDPSWLMVGHVLRFDPRIWRAREAVASGSLGEIHSISIRRSNARKTGKKVGQRTSITWFLGIHDIDLVLWVTGLKPRRIAGVSGKKIFTNFYDQVFALIEMENGATLSTQNCWTIPDQRYTSMDAGMTIIGEKGMVEINLTHDDAVLTLEKDGRTMAVDTYAWPLFNGIPQGDLYRELNAFVVSARDGTVPPVTAEEAREAVRVVEQIEEMLNRV